MTIGRPEIKWRSVGLRLRIPKAVATGHAAAGLAELFDIETGEAFTTKWDSLLVDYSPDGCVVVTAKFIPEKLEVVEFSE